MRRCKTFFKCGFRNMTWRLSEVHTLSFVLVALFNLMLSTIYIIDQFEIKQSVLILNREGCTRLLQIGITPLPQAHDTCRIQADFRSNRMDDGGRMFLDELEFRIPEPQLVIAMPLKDQLWDRRHWILIVWEITCVMLMLGAMWTSSIRRLKEGK